MIKKLQALKAKKGFTLVELIVVIAIIGVLAAILVPTMLGMVTKSRVTSADSTAKSLRDEIGNFLTDADSAGYGMLRDATKIDTVSITVKTTSGKTEWTVSGITPGNYKKMNGTNSWGASATASAGDTKAGVTDPTKLMAIYLADTFTDIKVASIVAVLKGGRNCSALAYTADTGDGLSSTEYPTVTSGEFPSAFTWDTHTAGISSSGYIVGTAPKVDIG
ncbi:MAG: type II secretion system protein [Oscillospiraceae bacterium]